MKKIPEIVYTLLAVVLSGCTFGDEPARLLVCGE